VSTTPTVADDTRVALLAVRLRPTSPTTVLHDVLASMAVVVAELERLLARLELAGLVEERDGGESRWRLTADGRKEGERLLSVELDERGVRAAVTAGYERFVSLNSPLLHACTDWQLRDANPSAPVVNDHTDPAYDGAVIARLGAIHDTVLPVCDDLAVHLPRLTGYGPRFATAWERIEAGDLDAFDTPASTDSYHSIWFELHDNLLATLGRDRSDEPLPAPAKR
jgi:hypothetical protein